MWSSKVRNMFIEVVLLSEEATTKNLFAQAVNAFDYQTKTEN